MDAQGSPTALRVDSPTPEVLAATTDLAGLRKYLGSIRWERLDEILDAAAKRTPGRWTSRKFDECQTAIVAEPDQAGRQALIATMAVGEGRPHGEANTALVAALPEMLEHLKYLGRRVARLEYAQAILENHSNREVRAANRLARLWAEQHIQ